MSSPLTKGPVIRNRETRAERLAFARSWRAQMKPFFDALYGQPIGEGPEGTYVTNKDIREQRKAEACAWHLRMKPHFDAIYGPTTCHGPACSAARGEVA